MWAPRRGFDKRLIYRALLALPVRHFQQCAESDEIVFWRPLPAFVYADYLRCQTDRDHRALRALARPQPRSPHRIAGPRRFLGVARTPLGLLRNIIGVNPPTGMGLAALAAGLVATHQPQIGAYAISPNHVTMGWGCCCTRRLNTRSGLTGGGDGAGVQGGLGVGFKSTCSVRTHTVFHCGYVRLLLVAGESLIPPRASPWRGIRENATAARRSAARARAPAQGLHHRSGEAGIAGASSRTTLHSVRSRCCPLALAD